MPPCPGMHTLSAHLIKQDSDGKISNERCVGEDEREKEGVTFTRENGEAQRNVLEGKKLDTWRK